MKKLLLSGITAVALMSAGTAHAANAGLSLNGETGVARTPMAMTLPAMTLGVAADYVASEDTFVPMRLAFGVIDGLEIAGKYYFIDTEGDPKPMGVSAKYVLPVQLAEGLAIAAGVSYESTSFEEGDDLTDLGFYGVATYTATVGDMAILPSFGVAYDSLSQGDYDESGVRFFGSLVAMVMPNLAIGGEFVSVNEDLDGEDADASVWFGARFMPMDSLTVQAGMINYANIGGDDPKDYVFHVGGQYAFGFGM